MAWHHFTNTVTCRVPIITVSTRLVVHLLFSIDPMSSLYCMHVPEWFVITCFQNRRVCKEGCGTNVNDGK